MLAEWVPIREPKGEMDMEFAFKYDVVLGEGEHSIAHARGIEIATLCRGCCAGVRFIILTKLAECT